MVVNYMIVNIVDIISEIYAPCPHIGSLMKFCANDHTIHNLRKQTAIPIEQWVGHPVVMAQLPK